MEKSMESGLIKKLELPRRICTAERLQKLLDIGIKTDGYDRSLEKILKKTGYKKPFKIEQSGSTYYGFSIDGYQRLYLNYTDALAEKILFLNDFRIYKFKNGNGKR